MTLCKLINIKKEDEETIKFNVEFIPMMNNDNKIIFNAKAYIPDTDTSVYLELLYPSEHNVQLSIEIPLIGYIKNPNTVIINKIKEFINLITKEMTIFGYSSTSIIPKNIVILANYIEELALGIKSDYVLLHDELHDTINRTIAEMIFNDLLSGAGVSPLPMNNVIDKIKRIYKEDFDIELNNECISIIKIYIEENWFK